ncbi:MAG: RNA 2',3'-cyclic phosphodiesterase [Candidatus Micrarchaeota archaeon]|nr:RNA 2',3'-cyclic phosphodiesterase [Candidatus Micrarchaeota archaeon]MDE1824585.1 RNA 2',3'-cyclic phosphodiesterase [Candidatus Micrarchaeota archaeon]MDE1850071.1 RNA 2',3'-cyclic phosphodiesterase [Candidatus Micrarchaeota archaeon]
MRAFIGIDIPEDIKDAILKASEDFAGSGITLVKRDALHITIRFLGEIQESKTELLCNIIKSVKPGPFGISVSGIGTFGGRQPHVVYLKIGAGNSEISSIYNSISGKLGEAGLLIEEGRAYVPHVTIARVKRGADTRKLNETLDRYVTIDFGSFGNPLIFLKKGVLTGDGPVYTTLFSRSL